MKPVGFDWDDDKAAANLAKHLVSFEEAISVFDDPLARIHDDPDHSGDEMREIITGMLYRARGRDSDHQCPQTRQRRTPPS
jgi:uncharacterized DUF497 family protein